MIDPYGRRITYLRVSITDRCNFRCFYCMSEDMEFLPKTDILSLEEIDRVCSVFVSRGVRKLRVTGGEPLVRRNAIALFRSLGRHLEKGDLDELTLTTNGVLLTRHAKELFDCGVRRVNVSLDTLDPQRFALLTRFGQIEPVLEGIAAARKAGLKVKINTVALRGVNDDEVEDIVRWCTEHGSDLTFIETMPLGEIETQRTDHYLPLTEVRARLARTWHLEDIDDCTGGPARYVRIVETGSRVGFITPMTHNFCETCNRVRLTSTGTLFMCLGQEDSVDLRTPMRESDDDAILHAAIDSAVALKPKGHEFTIDSETKRPSVARHMSMTGG